MKRRRCPDRLRPIAILAIAGGLSTGLACGRSAGQDLANPVINDFEIAPAGSLEWDILDRLASMNRYDPRDLFRLARMTVLESIAMYENLRADAPGVMTGAGREGEMSYLWDSAELFYATVAPSDVPSSIRARPLLGDVEAAYLQLERTLGSMPGVSPQATLHLQNVARMLPVMNALIDAMEADQGVPVGVAAVPAPASGPALLGEQARGLVQALRGAAQALKDAKPAPAGRDALLADLDSLIDLVRGLDRMLADGAPAADLIETLRLIRGRLWPIQARFLQAARTPALAARWRPIRERVNGLSDGFDRPRVIAIRPAAPRRPAADVDRRLLAQADRSITTLDEFASQVPAGARAMAGGLQYREELGQLRRRLLLFREQVAAGESVEALTRSLREIEDLNRRLGDRARSESRVFRANTPRLDTRGLQAASQDVEKLRGLLPKAAEGTRKPGP